MKVTPEIYAWLASLNIITPYKSSSEDLEQDFIIPQNKLSSLFFGKYMDIIIQPLQKEYNNFYNKKENYVSKLLNLKNLPENHEKVSPSIINGIKHDNWKLIFEVLSKLGLRLSEGDIILLMNNDKNQLNEIITKIYNLYIKYTYKEETNESNYSNNKSKSEILDIDELDSDKKYKECNSLLELIIISMSKNMNVKPRQAIALLSNNRKYLKKICLNGYVFDFQLVKNWLSDLCDNCQLLVKLIKHSEDNLKIFFETIGTILYCKDLDTSLQAGELLNIIKEKVKMNWRWFYTEGINAFIFILNKENSLFKKEFLKLFEEMIMGQSSVFFDELKKKYYLGETKLVYDFLSNIINSAVNMDKEFILNLQNFIFEFCINKTKDISFNLSILSDTIFNFPLIEKEKVNQTLSYFKNNIKESKENIWYTGICQMFNLMERFGKIKNKYAPQLYKIIVELFLETFDNEMKREIFLENFEKFFNENQDIPIDIFLEPYLNKLNNCQNYILDDFLFIIKMVEHPRIEWKDISEIIQFILYVCLYNVNYTRSANLILSLIFEKELITKNKNDDESLKSVKISEMEDQFSNFIHSALDLYVENAFKKDDKVILETPYEIMTQNFAEVNLRIKNKIIKSIQRYRRLKGYHSNGLLAMLWFYEDHDDILMSSEEINRPIYEPMKKYLERKRLEQKEKDDKSFTKRQINYLNKLTHKKWEDIMKKKELIEKNKKREEKIKQRLNEIRNITKFKLRPMLLPKEFRKDNIIMRNNSQIYNIYKNNSLIQKSEKINKINNINNYKRDNDIKLSRSHSELNIYEGNNEKDIIKQYKLLIKYEQNNKYGDKQSLMKLIKPILIRKEDTVLNQDLYNKNRKYFFNPEIFIKYLFIPFDLKEEEDRELQAIKGYNEEYKKNLVYYFKIYCNEAKEKISKMKIVKLLRELGFDKEKIDYKEINILLNLMFKYNLTEFDFNQFINISFQLSYIIFSRFKPCITIGEAYGNLLRRFAIKQINQGQIIFLQKKYRQVIQNILELRRNKEQFNMPEGFKIVKKTTVRYKYRLAPHMLEYLGEAKYICYQILEEVIFDVCKSSMIEPYIDVNTIDAVEIEPEKIHNWSPGLTMAYVNLDKRLKLYGMFAADALEEGIRKMLKKNYENNSESDIMNFAKGIFNLKWAQKGIMEKKQLRVLIENEKKKTDLESEDKKYKKFISQKDYVRIKKKFKKIEKKIEEEKIKKKEEEEAKEKLEMEREEMKKTENKSINFEINKRMKIQLKKVRDKRIEINKINIEEEKRNIEAIKRRDYIICEEDKKNNDFERNIYNSIKKMMEKKEIKRCITKYLNHLKVIYDIYSKMSLNKMNTKQVIHIDGYNQFLVNFTILGVYISLEQMNYIFKNISKVSQSQRNNDLYLDFEDFKVSIGYLTIFSNSENKSWKLKPKDIEEINAEKIEIFFQNIGLKIPFNKLELEKFINDRRNMSAKNFLNLQQTKKREDKNSLYNKQLSLKEEIEINQNILQKSDTNIDKTEEQPNIEKKDEMIQVQDENEITKLELNNDNNKKEEEQEEINNKKLDDSPKNNENEDENKNDKVESNVDKNNNVNEIGENKDLDNNKEEKEKKESEDKV